MENELNKIFASGLEGYELIDAGGNKKLERWGEIVTIRPERQAYFQSGMPFKEWEKIAHLEFLEEGNKSGKWITKRKLPEKEWVISFRGVSFKLEKTGFKHLGLFPEQVVNWRYLDDLVKKDHKVLNLFAYTGAASLVCKAKGADVVHVDAVKQLISWARENMVNSGLEGIRWVHEDALKFAERELKRGNAYDVVIMDPPAWGVGAKKEKWKIEDKLGDLLQISYGLLNPGGRLILNTYSPRIEYYHLENLAAESFGNFELSELWMESFTKKKVFCGYLLRATK
ncbi:MAG: class I SAM-dependent methyltransferase [Brumimicrobium sp.]|nr:class I SAM-dependent methyltransferase [Brumimicrobium sp.]